ncbi:MAG: hypothetical protein WCD19_09505, partial [Nitrososphaeraceae archaeon]
AITLTVITATIANFILCIASAVLYKVIQASLILQNDNKITVLKIAFTQSSLILTGSRHKTFIIVHVIIQM